MTTEHRNIIEGLRLLPPTTNNCSQLAAIGQIYGFYNNNCFCSHWQRQEWLQLFNNWYNGYKPITTAKTSTKKTTTNTTISTGSTITDSINTED